MLSYVKRIGKSFLDLIYPPLCLHCRVSLESENPIFCETCLTLMQLIDPAERCPYCFSSEFSPLTEKCCHRCIHNPLMIDRVAAAFDYEGPAGTLVKQLKYAGQTHLALGAGAYLAAQFMALDWPMPDVVVPMPASRLKRLERGFNQSQLLAKAFADILDCPVMDILQRRSGDFSQAGLNFEERLKLSSITFNLKPDVKLYGKTVLLIDDVMTTGTTLKCCAEVLRQTFPSSVYALTFCRAL